MGRRARPVSKRFRSSRHALLVARVGCCGYHWSRPVRREGVGAAHFPAAWVGWVTRGWLARGRRTMGGR